ncbi:DUF4129 domain-containing protein [Meiothermus cerbereus]|uniref:DUF4129 domain-containing protein n=1 Tax=Meiothermus cerbereus TaxID=65552 RepID=UPI003EEDC3AE
MHFFVSEQTRAIAAQPHWVLAATAGGILLGVAEPELRLGLLLGMGLFVLLWCSRYRDGFLWFAAFPGLVHLLTPLASWEAAWPYWFQTTFLLWVFGLMVGRFQRQERWAVGPGLGLLLLYPSGLVLALLLGLHLAWGLVREFLLAQSLGRRFCWRPAGLLALGLSGALFFLGLGFVQLNWPGFPDLIEQSRPLELPVAPALPEAPGASGPAVRWVQPAGSPLKPWLPLLNRALEGLQLAMLLILALVLVAAFWGHRARGGAVRGSFVLPVLAVALTWVLLLAGLRGSSQGGGFASPGGLERPTAPLLEWQERAVPPGFTETGYLLAFLMALGGFFLLLGLLYGVWRLRQTEAGELPTPPLPGQPRTPRLAPTDPIRQAYWTFEQRMRQLGLPRPPSVSPARYVEEVSARQPQVKAMLSRLLELYQQVRYGGRRLPQHALEARQLAEEIPRRFPPP